METSSKNEFSFPGVVLTSCFDSGNLKTAQETEQGFDIRTFPDPGASTTSNWFYFRATVQDQRTIKFTIKNLGKILRILKFGMRPVLKTPTKPWKRFEINFKKGAQGTQISFQHFFEQNQAQFAFTYPYTVQENYSFFQSIPIREDIYIHKTVLCHSVQNRPCQVIVLSSCQGQSEINDYGWASFPGKQAVIISARVHPGQAASSYVMKGLVQFLLSEDPRAAVLKEAFVFILVPMLNPDGVYNGFFRYDTLGHNLNRCYNDPDQATMPTIYHLKELLFYYQFNAYAFIDLHAHMSIKGIFMLGNFNKDFNTQVELCSLPKFMSLNNPHFHYDKCDFSIAGMQSTDSRKESKQGCGRVCIYRQTNILRTYTVQSNFYSGITTNSLQNFPSTTKGSVQFDPQVVEKIGESLMVSLLDCIDRNPLTLLPQCPFPSQEDFKVHTAKTVAGMVPFRYYNQVKRAAKTTESMQEFLKENFHLD